MLTEGQSTTSTEEINDFLLQRNPKDIGILHNNFGEPVALMKQNDRTYLVFFADSTLWNQEKLMVSVPVPLKVNGQGSSYKGRSGWFVYYG